MPFPRDCISVTLLLPPENTVIVGDRTDNIRKTVIIDVIDQNRRRMPGGSFFFAAQCQRMLDPWISPRIFRGLEPGGGAQHIHTPVTIDIPVPYAKFHFFF